MDLLKSLLETNPEIEEIDLSGQGITDLGEVLPALALFSDMKRLNLRGCGLMDLPEDLGALEKTEVLDLRGNELREGEELIESLRTMPVLREVMMTSLGEQTLKQLRRQLPGVTVSCQSTGFEDIVEVGTVEDEDQLDIFPKEEIELVATLYDDIRDLGQKRYPATAWKVDFGEFIANLAQETSAALKSAPTPTLAETIRLRARRKLFDCCADELIAVTASVQPELARLWERLVTVKEEVAESGLQAWEKGTGIENARGKGQEQVERLRKEWLEEKEELMLELEGLKEENQKYLDAIIRHSKSSAEAALGPSTRSPEVRQPSALSISSSPGRQLSLNQLKEFIEEVYQAKIKFDQRCVEARLAIEHLSDFLKTHLTHKFGLKSLRQEWLAGVWQAIDRYADEDNDVAVFGKIVRNECDEDFRFVQMQVKETATQLLRLFLREKFPLKSASGLESLLNARINGQLAEEEWVHVVTYMYNETDALLLVSLIRELMQQRNVQSPQAGKQLRLSREEVMLNREKERALRSRIPFAELLKILLDFQLKGHEKFLQGFLRRFESADRDEDGYLNEKEFRELAESLEMGLSSADMERLLQLIDPYDYQKINFSQCVSLFTNVSASQETVVADESEPGKLVSVLQKLAISESDGFNIE